MSRKDTKKRMLDRAKQTPGGDLDAFLAEAAAFEVGNVPTTVSTSEDTAHRIAVEQILPDPIQPRRAMPELLRARWCDGAPMVGVLAQWERDVQDDLRQRLDQTLDWSDWIEGGQTAYRMAEGAPAIQDTTHLLPITRAWFDLVRLATEIYHDGLIHAVAVYEVPDGYRLLHGERRLLAFWLLTWLGYEGFETIPVIQESHYNPFIQAAENGARKNLNAISIARQLAIILKALNEQLAEVPAQPGQTWYAEAADLVIPHGMADQVAHMLGLSSPRHMRRYRALLDLPREVWNWADEFDWTEGKLRGMVQRAQNADQLVRMAQNEVTLSLGGEVDKPAVTALDRAVTTTRRAVKSMQRSLNLSEEDLDALPKQAREDLITAARQILIKFDPKFK